MPDKILFSAPGAGLGGLFVASDGAVSMLDPVATSGLSSHEGLLYRLISCDRQGNPASDLIVYDDDGPIRTQRLDGVAHAHDVLPCVEETLVVSTATNAVYSILPNGRMKLWWQANPSYDAWHVNCLLRARGEIYATAFGRFESSYGWNSNTEANSGIFFRLPSGKPLIAGLNQPHHPRWFDDMWVVCNSRKNELLAFDDRGTILRKRLFEGYTRGLTVDADFIYVGENQPRRQGFPQRTAHIKVLQRKTWETVASIATPVPEIYDLVVVPAQFASIFKTNLWHSSFTDTSLGSTRRWMVGEPLNRADMRAILELSPPESVERNATFEIKCRVVNLGREPLISAPPYPVEMAYNWWTLGNQPLPLRTVRTELPLPIDPGEQIEMNCVVAAPSETGHYQLVITLIQVGLLAFDQVDPRNVARAFITVRDRARFN